MTSTAARETIVTHADALAEDTPLAAQIGATDVVVVRHSGSITAFEGRCPHRGTLLAEGVVDAGEIVCAGHGWRFDAQTGVNADPSRPCLRRLGTRVVDGHVLVDTSAPASGDAGAGALRTLDDLPGPRGFPLLGNLLQLDLARLHAVLEDWVREHGDTYLFRIARNRVVVTSAPDLMRDVLRRRPQEFRRIGTIEPVLTEMGALGVFAAEGNQWRRQRKLVARALDAGTLRRFFPTLSEITRRLHRHWTAAAESGAVIDIQQDLMRYTVDVTASLVFGHDINTLEKDGDVIQRHLEHIFPMINRRINAPIAYWRTLRLPSDRALDAALLEVHAYCRELIADARVRMAADPELATRPNNLLEALLAATSEDDERLTEDELLGNMLTMLVAGEDTTANTLAWMVHLVGRSPEVAQSLHREIDGAPDGEIDTYADLGRLPYTDAVVSESMRLKPVAPAFFLEANDDVVIGDISVPRGTGVVLLTRPAGMDGATIDEPEAFRPQRWLTSAAPRSDWRSDLMPFGGGPRFCPGRNLALIETKMVTIMLYRHFEVDLVGDPDAVGERFAFTMMPTDLRVRLRPRDRT